MRIRSLTLSNFGPFHSYQLNFAQEDPACMLITGKNNEGKSNVLLALKLVNEALEIGGMKRQRIMIDDDEFYRLPQQAIQNMNIGRMIHNYKGGVATIEVKLNDGFEIAVTLDSGRNMIYTDFDGTDVLHDATNIFGFIPPLGPLAENEELLTEKHVRASFNTSLAPRHLRNHFRQILLPEEYEMIQKIIRESWPSVQLLDYEYHSEDNTLMCFFKEDRIEREIAWAGQGFQVWLQIVTHLVRLRSKSVLILDEPEINLHPEKQNDLIRILREYYAGSTIIATHSVELINNVNVSHIIHVQKKDHKPTIKSSDDRVSLNIIRSRIGSNFNLIASQFENCDLILYTEDTFDFSIIQDLAKTFGLTKKVFNIPIHGLSEFSKAIAYKEAYGLLIGGSTNHTMLLDRDYYPESYLTSIRDKLNKSNIKTLFTPGKEIENIFLEPSVINLLIPNDHKKDFELYWDAFFKEIELDCFGSYQSLHERFLDRRKDPKTVIKEFKPIFDRRWNDRKTRYLIVDGKEGLGRIRKYYQSIFRSSLTQNILIKAVAEVDTGTLRSFVEQLHHTKQSKKQCLHY
jgi:predicted ATPase